MRRQLQIKDCQIERRGTAFPASVVQADAAPSQVLGDLDLAADDSLGITGAFVPIGCVILDVVPRSIFGNHSKDIVGVGDVVDFLRSLVNANGREELSGFRYVDQLMA